MLYPKQLNSLEELQAERASVKRNAQKRAAELEQEHASDKSILQEGIGLLSGTIGANSTWAPLISTISQLALPALMKRGLEKGIRHAAGSLLREVGTGYLKWKAMDIALRYAARKMKEKTKKEA